MSNTTKPVGQTISGKDIQRFRTKVLGQTQVQFARWLSEQSGEPISSQAVCRYERYRATKACNPLRPPEAVLAALGRSYDLSGKRERKTARAKQPADRSGTTEESERAPGVRLSRSSASRHKSPMLSPEESHQLTRALEQYRSADLSAASLEAAAEMIRDIRTRLLVPQEQQQELANQPGYVDQLTRLRHELYQLDYHGAKIDADIDSTLKQLDVQLQHLRTLASTSRK